MYASLKAFANTPYSEHVGIREFISFQEKKKPNANYNNTVFVHTWFICFWFVLKPFKIWLWLVWYVFENHQTMCVNYYKLLGLRSDRVDYNNNTVYLWRGLCDYVSHWSWVQANSHRGQYNMQYIGIACHLSDRQSYPCCLRPTIPGQNIPPNTNFIKVKLSSVIACDIISLVRRNFVLGEGVV